MQRVDAVVIGGGIMGAATAWWLARRGHEVTLLEQFEPGHARGSSHGGSRIFRLAYPDPFWIDLARAAREDWRELEGETGDELLVLTGSIDHGDPAAVDGIEAALDLRRVRHDRLEPDAATDRWPGLRFDGPVLHQPDGGRIAADRALAAMSDRVRALGGIARWSTPARAVDVIGDRARVATDDETYDARVAVIAAGAWVADLLPETVPVPPLVVTQESAFHFAPRDGTRWPSFIHHRDGARYGLETPGEGVKVAEHHTGPVVTADTRDFVVDAAARDRVVAFVGEWLPGLEPAPVSEVTCLYTSTATEDFVVDRVGPIVVASPCSGHGFKFAPTIGRLVADLVTGAAPVPRFTLAEVRP